MADIDRLFETHSVAELVELRNTSKAKIETSQNELRSLVAQKYRDLLHVADNIIEMNSVVSETNKELSQLAFSKSRHASKYLSNLNGYRKRSRVDKVVKVKTANRDVVFNNLVHDLNYSLLKLKHGAMDDADDFVKLAKHCYLLQLIFKETLSSNTGYFPVVKFQQLRNEFARLIQSQIILIEEEFEAEFYLGLLVSHILVTGQTPLESAIWSIDVRVDHMEKASSCWSFNKLLTYSFLTLQMTLISNQKLSVLLSRQVATSSQWFHQTGFVSWENWLDLQGFKLDFPKTLTSGFVIDTAVKAEWEMRIGALFKSSYDRQLALDDDKVSIGIKCLTIFKSFSSLTKIKFNDSESAMGYILNSVEDNLVAFTKEQLDHLTHNCDSILNKFENIEHIETICTKSGLNLFTDVTLNELVETFNKPQEPNVFQKNTEAIIQNIESIKKLSRSIRKPVLSIDDTDDDEFWTGVSKRLSKDVVDQSVAQCNKTLKETFDTFLSQIQDKLKMDKENVQWLFLIRSLIKFETEFNIVQFQKSLGEINATAADTIDTSTEFQTCILESFRKVFNGLHAKYANDIAHGYKLEANLFGVSIEDIVLDMVLYLRRPHGKEDFADVFGSEAIEVQDEFLTRLTTTMRKEITQVSDNLTSEEAITAYSNCCFVESMLSSKPSSLESDAIMTHFKTTQAVFPSGEKLSLLQSTVKDHFHTERIIFSPL